MCDALHYLLDNIFIRFGSKLYRQIVGIPMGTNCAPLDADLFLFCYKRDFMLSLSDNNQTDIIEAFNSTSRYTETIKLCPLDVYVCQFQIYERISFKFSHYTLRLFSNGLHLRDIHLIISRAADKAAKTSTLKIKSHINRLCVRHNPKPFKHI